MEFVSQVEKTNNTTTNNNTNAMFMSTLDRGFEFSKPPIAPSDSDRSQIALENWLQLYHRNHFSQSNDQAMQMGTNSNNGVLKSNAELSNSTVVTTKTLPVGSLCVNSAPTKASKKRSRASRRAPTTLLSTDTSNFRAMVQQFTGIPESPFALGRSFTPTSSLLSYNTHPPQRYSPLRFHDDLNANPFFFPRATASQAQPPPPPLLDDMALNPAAASLFSSPVMLSSERRNGYLI
ncbi:hypothetical protein SUGI_0815270 [Cryptomeria japonica]|uniref:uncharacterized protein LOC131048430 n=1 Tax=Cryptomeria japonica TaxID=3369 RepID=UPI002414CCEC|nr:uncharacterized protein LOC131048430 [Cryptomeria japonica]GLJ39866.1 hypothetical protein SUGI_0815270 [Cryptomeria japonica]